MAASRAQRISIWIIAAALAIGTVGSFVVIILANDNARTDQAKVTQLEQQYQDDYQKYQIDAAAQMAGWSTQYYPDLAKYKDHPAPFNADAVDELAVVDLKEGVGDVITEDSTFYAFYIGWNPDGVVFDSSFIDGEESLKSPFEAYKGGVISGWTEGLNGAKSGGVRELTIPADEAYGDVGSGDLIQPGMPIKFIVLVIADSELVQPPQIPQELIDYYTRGVI